MRRSRRVVQLLLAGVIAGVIALCVGAAGMVPAQAATATAAAAKPQAWMTGVSAYDNSMLRYINTARARHKMGPLRLTQPLYVAALKWSARLATRRQLEHDPNLARSVGSAARCAGVRAWGENVAYTSRSAASMFVMYMNSPGHRANILNRSYTHVGVATQRAPGRFGVTNWNTMKFVSGRCA